MCSRFKLNVPEVLSPSLLYHATKSNQPIESNEFHGLDIFETKTAPPPRPTRRITENFKNTNNNTNHDAIHAPPPTLPPRRPPRANSKSNNGGTKENSPSSTMMGTSLSMSVPMSVPIVANNIALVPPVPPTRRKSVARRAFNFLDKKLVGDSKESDEQDTLIRNARNAGSMAGHLMLRKVEKKSLSYTNWKKRRVILSGARIGVYKPGDNSRPSEELLILHSSKVLPFQNDKKDTMTYGFKILHITELPTRNYRQTLTARVGDTEGEAKKWIERIQETINSLNENVTRQTPSLTGRNANVRVQLPTAGAASTTTTTIPMATLARPVSMGGGGSGGGSVPRAPVVHVGRRENNLNNLNNSNASNASNASNTNHATTHATPHTSTHSNQGQVGRGQPVYRRNKLKGLEAYQDLIVQDESARLLSTMVDSLDDAEDLKSQVFGELVESLMAKREELVREINGPELQSGSRYNAVCAVLEELEFVLQSHTEICAVFGASSSISHSSRVTRRNSNNNNNNSMALHIDELTQRAIERSRHEQ